MWEVYDDLIDAIPSDLTVEDCTIGLYWTLIRSKGTGMALTPWDGKSGPNTVGMAGRIAGMPVRELARLVKSWNVFEATLGLAAINSVLNTPANIEKLSGKPLADQAQVSAFAYFAEEFTGKKVTVIGLFPDLDVLADKCQLTILERRQVPGVLPDPACEYVLPNQDVVFITSTALLNKTLPRLLELSKNAHTIMVGPSTPLSPILFNHGVDILAGTVVADPEPMWKAVKEGSGEVAKRFGRMVKVSKQEATVTF